MTLLACGLLALGVLAYMISPMLERSDRRPWSARSARSAWAAWARRDDLQKKKDFIYSSIRELNIDYSMGKLAAEDHETLRQEYMNEASDVLDELDRTAGSDLPVEEQIEEAVLEIRRRREPGAAVVEAPVEVTKNSVERPTQPEQSEQPVQPAQPLSGQACGGCGTVNEESAKFCIECGASLTRITCEGCGTENPATAKFCAQCGTKLNSN